jgi:hypothetical protein
MIILKGRQQGASTYIEGRLYWNCTKTKGVRAFILAHESESTNSLFTMAKRYYENTPLPMRPELQTSNAKELVFSKLDSGYKIGTAGNKEVGRSQTNQFFHGSEVAFWENPGELVKGVLQTVPDMKGTEVYYESTANGMGNFFHEKCMDAMKGVGDFHFVFTPWYWQDEYKRDLPDDWKRTDQEQEYIERLGPDGLTDEHLNWRRFKIIDMKAKSKKAGLSAEASFKQEYPMDPSEAFQMSGGDGYITPDDVMRARRQTAVQPSGPLIIGVDPSRGGDRFAVCRRRGRVLYDFEAHTGELRLGDKVQICKRILDTENVNTMFVDMGGGDDLVDRLHELGYGRQVRGIWFGGKSFDPDKYKNKRAEMFGELNDWLTDETLVVSIPDDDTIQIDFCAPMMRRDSMDRMLMESKDDIKKRIGFSCDYLDAAMLTFAEPVREANSRSIRVKRAYTP